MTTTAISQYESDRPAVDVFIEKFARGLLRWTDQRSRTAEYRALQLRDGHGVRGARDCAMQLSAVRDHHLTVARSAGPFAR